MKLRESTLWPNDAAPAAAFCGDSERAKVVAAHGFDSLVDDSELTEIVRFAASLCDTPVALITLVESERQKFLAHTGVDIDSTPRSTSFCAYAMMKGDILVVPDATQDPRFANFELVTGDFGLRFYAGVPITSSEGAPIGALCVIDTAPRPEGLTDLQRQGLSVLGRSVKRRFQARREVRQHRAQFSRQSARFRTLGDWLPDIIWSADGTGRLDYFNARWEQVTGGAPPPDIEQWRTFVHPDDQERVFAAWTRSLARRESYETEYRLRQADGSWRWTIARAIPVADDDGGIARWYGTLTDIDERRRQADSSGTLAHELAHRIKNVFALISGLVSLRTRGHDELRAFGEDLVGTIASLGKAQDFVLPTGDSSRGDLRGLIAAVLEPFAGDMASERIAIEGDTAPVGSRAATSLALVLHEMATNSIKYGALAADDGRLAIELRIEEPEIVVSWVETGGRKPTPGGGGSGFGTRLIDMTMGQLSGTVERDWREQGLAAQLRLPVKRLAD
ncbi:PAS domain-containing protein [Pelagerythrobacter marensis]|uniref:histidine kinase n=1 Tax=Pelagerythrobacter marensis TaxID=543877 RepID=A0A0G3XAJ9_9SPHN|nr:PAS domain-containing protein [Pelagerythrobacter marensis]AKM08545.1 hypothetical protein AM2010_2490 [Pelagerythrobacter marensis]